MDVLLNWLAQGGVVAMAAALALRVIPPSRPGARCALASAAAAGVALLPAVPHVLGPAYGAPAALGTAILRDPVVTIPAAWWSPASLVAALWLVWAGVSAARLATGVAAVRRARRAASDCPDDVQRRLRHWPRVSSAGRKARLVVSSRIRAAAVLGCGSPLVSVAPALLRELSDADLDRVLVHEWAHVQRRDDLVQIAQRLVGLVAGWHPAVWWLQRQADLEREAACDAIAIGVTGGAREYAACLVAAAAVPPRHRALLAELSIAPGGVLRQRVARILRRPGDASAARSRAVTAVAGMALAAVVVCVGATRIVHGVYDPLAGPAVPAMELQAGVSDGARTRAVAISAGAEGAGPTIVTSEGPRHMIAGFEGAGPTDAAASVAVAIAPARRGDPLPSVGRFDWPLDAGAPAVASASVTVPAAGGEDGRPDRRPDRTVSASAVIDGRLHRPVVAAATEVGRRTQNAGIATGALFTRVGRKIAASF